MEKIINSKLENLRKQMNTHIYIILLFTLYGNLLHAQNKIKSIVLSDQLEIKISLPSDTTNISQVIIMSSEINDEDSTSFYMLLKKELENDHKIVISYQERIDSIKLGKSHYTNQTLENNLINLHKIFNYIKNSPYLSTKKNILIGGTSSVTFTADYPDYVNALLMINPIVMDYKTQKRYQDTIFMNIYGKHPKIFQTLNSWSSLKKRPYLPDIEGYRQFNEDWFGPLEHIMFKYNNYNIIARKIEKIIEKKWKSETDSIHKKYNSEFKEYLKRHQIKNFITPLNIDYAKWNPNQYYPHIKCSVSYVYILDGHNWLYQENLKIIKSYLGENLKPIALHITRNKEKNIHYSQECIRQIILWTNTM